MPLAWLRPRLRRGALHRLTPNQETGLQGERASRPFRGTWVRAWKEEHPADFAAGFLTPQRLQFVFTTKARRPRREERNVHRHFFESYVASCYDCAREYRVGR